MNKNYNYSHLVEDSPLSTNKGPHPRPLKSISVHIGVTDVEDSTVIWQVCVVTVLETVTTAGNRIGLIIPSQYNWNSKVWVQKTAQKTPG